MHQIQNCNRRSSSLSIISMREDHCKRMQWHVTTVWRSWLSSSPKCEKLKMKCSADFGSCLYCCRWIMAFHTCIQSSDHTNDKLRGGKGIEEGCCLLSFQCSTTTHTLQVVCSKDPWIISVSGSVPPWTRSAPIFQPRNLGPQTTVGFKAIYKLSLQLRPPRRRLAPDPLPFIGCVLIAE